MKLCEARRSTKCATLFIFCCEDYALLEVMCVTWHCILRIWQADDIFSLGFAVLIVWYTSYYNRVHCREQILVPWCVHQGTSYVSNMKHELFQCVTNNGLNTEDFYQNSSIAALHHSIRSYDTWWSQIIRILWYLQRKIRKNFALVYGHASF